MATGLKRLFSSPKKSDSFGLKLIKWNVRVSAALLVLGLIIAVFGYVKANAGLLLFLVILLTVGSGMLADKSIKKKEV